MFCHNILITVSISILFIKTISTIHSNRSHFLNLVLPSRTPFLISLFFDYTWHSFYMLTLAMDHDDFVFLMSFTHSWRLVVQNDKQLQHIYYFIITELCLNQCLLLLGDKNIAIIHSIVLSQALFTNLWLYLFSNHPIIGDGGLHTSTSQPSNPSMPFGNCYPNNAKRNY